jgi:hypothetical protein
MLHNSALRKPKAQPVGIHPILSRLVKVVAAFLVLVVYLIAV